MKNVFALIILVTVFNASAQAALPKPDSELLGQCSSFYVELRTHPDVDWEYLKEKGPLEDSFFTNSLDQDDVTAAEYIDNLKAWEDAAEGGFKQWCKTLKNVADENPDTSEEAAMCKVDLNQFCDKVFNPN